MVIGKDGLTTNSNPPIPQIAEESIWIAETTKRKKRAGADFIGVKRTDLTAKTAEPKQPRRRRENRILVELSDCFERSGRRLRASKNNQICAAHGCQRFPEPARGQQSLSSERPRGIHQKNVEVAGEL